VDCSAGATDLQIQSIVRRTSGDTEATFTMTDSATNQMYQAAELTPVQLPDRIASQVVVRAELEGSEKMSPIVYPGTQLIVGNANNSAEYITRAIKASTAFHIALTFQVYKPGTSTIIPKVEVQRVTEGADVIVDGVYQYDVLALTLDTRVPVGDGWYEEKWLGGVAAPNLRGVGLDRETRIVISLSGSAKFRPLARQLRAIIH